MIYTSTEFLQQQISPGIESLLGQGLFYVKFAYLGFLPQFKDMRLGDRLIVNSELTLGVNINGCLSYILALWWAGDLPKVYPVSCLKAAERNSSYPRNLIKG